VRRRAVYDDVGFSGATIDRPALQQLLEDIAAGRVDTLVVYKIDRLARSLADFAKIVEILDARGASFVSVTQQFNTTTSNGTPDPLRLVVLCAVRARGHRRALRDKIAASKRRARFSEPDPNSKTTGIIKPPTSPAVRYWNMARQRYYPPVGQMLPRPARLCRPRRSPRPAHPRKTAASRPRKANSRERQVRT
jgi:DNA invertase Pin-like site-specific DNA recombinase